jgi:hypothetical protein
MELNYLTNIREIIQSDVKNARIPVCELLKPENAMRCFTQLATELLNQDRKFNTKSQDVRKYDPEPVRDQIMTLIKWAYLIPDEGIDPAKGLLFKGHTGAGKTFIFRVFNYFRLIDRLTILYDGKQDYPLRLNIVNVRRIAGEYQDPEHGGSAVITKYSKMSCLVLDDIGTEDEISQSYGNKVNVVEEIISNREEFEMLTFGTTNLNSFSERYDDRTISRMFSLFNIVAFNHTIDFRRSM